MDEGTTNWKNKIEVKSCIGDVFFSFCLFVFGRSRFFYRFYCQGNNEKKNNFRSTRDESNFLVLTFVVHYVWLGVFLKFFTLLKLVYWQFCSMIVVLLLP